MEILSPVGREMIAPLIPALQEYYQNEGVHFATEQELSIDIAERFGSELEYHVCRPNNVYRGACLLLAVKAAKGEL